MYSEFHLSLFLQDMADYNEFGRLIEYLLLFVYFIVTGKLWCIERLDGLSGGGLMIIHCKHFL